MPESKMRAEKTRPKEPDHPIARYVRECRKATGLNATKFAELMEVTKGLQSQWESGQAHPRAEQLISMSLRSRVSLGRLTTLAAAYRGVTLPRAVEMEGRIALVPALLLDGVVSALEAAERMANQLPDGAFRRAVPDEKLAEWRAPTKTRKTPKE